MHPFILQRKPEFQSVIDHLLKELSMLRTGQASPSIVEEVSVSAYDSIMELKGLASITTLDTKTLIVDPWDKGLIQNIEKGIRDADLGISPVVDGNIIRIVMPLMTEENRIKLVKIVKDKLEDAQIGIRKVRESVRDSVMKQEKSKEISEDEKFKMYDEADKLTKEFSGKIVEIGKRKESEIMTI